jgi:uncharacterized protein YcbK (DUF882 family)
MLLFDRSNGLTQLSKNFKSKEFFCHCGQCTNQLVDPLLIVKLDLLREMIGLPIIINDAYRCEKHNADVGGVADSQHCKGKAADIRVEGVAPEDVARAAEKIGFAGVGRYATFCHVDVREKGPARWDYTKKAVDHTNKGC